LKIDAGLRRRIMMNIKKVREIVKKKGVDIKVGRKREDMAYLNGHASDLRKKDAVPQIQRKVTVQNEKILDFKLAPHTDIERS
jgi:hypothetical protein